MSDPFRCSTVSGTRQTRSTIFRILAEVDSQHDTDLIGALARPLARVLDQLEASAAQNDEARSQLLEERLFNAREQLNVMEKEQCVFCEKLDTDMDQTLLEWRTESNKLEIDLCKIAQEKKCLAAQLDDANMSLRDLRNEKSQEALLHEKLFAEEVSETVHKLERFVDDKKDDLKCAHQELDNSVCDIEKIFARLAVLHKENGRLIRNNSNLVEELSDLSGRQMTMQLQLDRALKTQDE